MSTNTTNTNNGAGGHQNGVSKSARSGGEGTKSLPFATFPLPDPETLERLANEFFLAVPRDIGNGNESFAPDFPEESADGKEIPTTLLTEDTLPLQAPSPFSQSPDMPGLDMPAANMPGSLPATSLGPLTENDLRAIAASLAGSMALVPGAPGTAPTPPAPGSPPDFLAGGKISPLVGAPTIPPGNEMFSFPVSPANPPVAPTALPSGADVASIPQTPASVGTMPGLTPYAVEGGKGASPAAVPALPPINDLFSFPRVPALPNISGIQTVPNPPAPPASPSGASPTSADGMAASTKAQSTIPAPAPIASAPAHDQKGVTPEVPGAPSQPATAGVTELSGISAPAGSGESVYPGAVQLFPSLSEMFSFPAVPGTQSAPGVPVLPASVPTATPKQSDLSSIPNPVLPPNTPGASSVPASVTASVPTGASAPGAGPVPTSHAFEFQPDVVPDLGVAKRPLDPRLVRRDFPILEERIHGRQLVWLDNAATTQKPNAVIDRISYFYRHENSNIHRAAHTLAARATDAYESAREKARRFLNASSTREIVFVRGTTEGINLIAQSWGRRNVQKDDEIVITWLEHHANIVPWQQLCAEKGARLRVAPVNDRGEVILEEYEKLLGPRTRIVSFSQVSNALGTIAPARQMVEMAHRHGACVLVDGAQAVSHMRADVQDLNCDFYVFSGHKVFGPTGIGVVYGKLSVLENTPPWQGGGNMIVDVTFEKTVYQGAPARFEAGTGNIADAVGLGAALDYVEQIGMENIAAYEHELLNYGTAKLLTVPGLRLIGTAREKAGVMSFVLDDVRTEDVGVALNQEGIAVRSGHHCAQPILRRMGVESTVRPSLAFYNTCEEIDQLVAALLRIQAGRGHRKAS
jgi:cysteine desulfurase / selenocysteine lyase